MAKKKPKEPEYMLNIFHQIDERTNEKAVVFLLETITEFRSFNYEILLEDKIVGREIEFKIVGLQTPPIQIPATGPARAQREYRPLRGRYVLKISKPDGAANQFALHISPDRIRIEDSPPTPFIIVTAE